MSTEERDTNMTPVTAWYLLQIYSGQEEEAKRLIEKRVSGANLQDSISEIIIPKNEAANYNERQLYTGWVFLKMRMELDAWNLIRTTPGAIGFVGLGNTPTPFQNRNWKEIPFADYTKR